MFSSVAVITIQKTLIQEIITTGLGTSTTCNVQRIEITKRTDQFAFKSR